MPEKFDCQMNFCSIQQSNRELKKTGALAGINEVVTEGDRTLPKASWSPPTRPAAAPPPTSTWRAPA